MPALILGLALWYFGHFFKRLAPGLRQGMGSAGKGVAAVLVLAGVVLMVVGFRDWAAPQVWTPPSWTIHLNNVLVLLGFYLYAAAGTKARLATKMRHPMLSGFKAWALAHLLVNGDLASIVLFGGLLAWAVLSVIVINRAQPDWTPPAWGGRKAELRATLGALIAFGAVAAIHMWLGYSPFPG